MNCVFSRRINFNVVKSMNDVALTNKDFKQTWLKNYYPYSSYAIQNNNLVLGGNEIRVDQVVLTQEVMRKSNEGYNANQGPSQAGGNNMRELKNFRVSGDTVNEAFKKLEKKANKYFRKNNLEGGNSPNGKEKMYALTLKSLDGEKLFIKIYRKKNI